MEVIMRFLVFSSTVFISLMIPVRSANSCDPVSCIGTGPEVRFPFRLKDRQPERCGNRGFELYCNSRNQTILNLPESGEFAVSIIDYGSQAVYIHDPGSCIQKRLMNFSIAGTPFIALVTDYVLFNCSGLSTEYPPWNDYVPLRCNSGGTNHTVVAVRSYLARPPPRCRTVGVASVPLWREFSGFEWPRDVMVALELGWREPVAGWGREIDGQICGREGESGRQIGCSRPSRPGLPATAKYALIIGVGIPGILCIIGLISYAFGLVRTSRHQERRGFQLPITRLSYETNPIAGAGLDQPTIESYPVTVLGESRRLPKPSDSTCPICLCEYEAKETLRSIPECNHYFHADCVDEWLRLNGSCPVCRHSLESSSDGTWCSSTSLSSPEPSVER